MCPSTVQELFPLALLEEHLVSVSQAELVALLRYLRLLRTGLQTRCFLEGGRHFLALSGAVQAAAAVVAAQLVEPAQAVQAVAAQARSWSMQLR